MYSTAEEVKKHYKTFEFRLTTILENLPKNYLLLKRCNDIIQDYFNETFIQKL